MYQFESLKIRVVEYKSKINPKHESGNNNLIPLSSLISKLTDAITYTTKFYGLRIN